MDVKRSRDIASRLQFHPPQLSTPAREAYPGGAAGDYRWHDRCTASLLNDRRMNEENAMSQSLATTDHNEIRQWIESRGGKPAAVAATMKDGDPGILRVDFDAPEKSLEPIDWETFFDAFEKNNLVFLYQDETADGKTSRFFKFVSRDSVYASQ
jgi:hypothetical protein